MGRILVLPDPIINRIAAGEVVERPASVVKELIENSLDAGSTSIAVRIEEGGRRLVEVRDDGVGMDADDAVAALQRHATSKLTAESSLEAIETLGFRGEALPSIAAVSRLTLTTSQGEGGTRVEVEGGRILSSGPAAHPRGTTLASRDLFFNTPARRRFLRATGTETGHIVEIFTGLAFSRPDVAFRLQRGGQRLFDLPAAPDRIARLAQIEGPDAARDAVLVEAERSEVSVSGFIAVSGRSGAARGSRRLIVNGRVVRDRMLTRALTRALEESLPRGSEASCLVEVRLPTGRVDVNVHPAKAEVRFLEPGLVFDLLSGAVRDALGAARPMRAGPIPAPISGPGPGGRREGFAPALDMERRAIAEAAASYIARREGGAGPAAGSPAIRPGAEDVRIVDAGEAALPTGAAVVIGHYRGGYILAEDDEGLLLIDQHAAHERILFEEMVESERRGAIAAQALLFPRSVTIPAALRGQSTEIAADLTALGFEVEGFGEDTLLVRAVPAPLGEADPERLLLEILAARDEEERGSSGIEGRRHRMLASAACHAAVKVPARLTPEKIEFILGRLLECGSPLRCPHGRPTILRWSHRVIERRFLRP